MAGRRIDGIQWLRAAMSVFVVAWHLGGGGTSAIWTDQYRQHVYTASDLANFQVLLLAVPTFMLISNYLLATASPDAAKAWSRAARVGTLLLFWPFMLAIYQGGWGNVLANLPGTPKDALVYVLTGAYSVYYFFVSVLITYVVTWLAGRLSTAANVVLLVLATLATAAAPLVSIARDWPLLSAYWSPVNFLPYAFAGIVVARLLDLTASDARVLTATGLLVLLGCVLAVAEWRHYPHAVFFPGQGYAFPAYTRASLVAFAMALLVPAIRWSPGVPPLVDFMARYSLALYCLHLFAAEPMRLVVKAVGAGLPPLGQAWLLIALTIAVSYAAAKALSLVWKDRLLF